MSATTLFPLIQTNCTRTWQVHHIALQSVKLTPWPHYTPAPMMPTFLLWLMSVSFVLCGFVISWCLFRCRCLDNGIDVVLFEEKWLCMMPCIVTRCLRKAMLVEFRDGRGTMEICVALDVAQQPTTPQFEELLDVDVHLCFNNTIACPYKNVVMKKTMLLVGLDLCFTFLNTLSVFTLCDLTRILCKGEM